MYILIFKIFVIAVGIASGFHQLNLIHNSCYDSLSRCQCSVSPVLLKMKDLHLCTLISISWQDWISPCQRLIWNVLCQSINWQISKNGYVHWYCWEKLHVATTGSSMSVCLLMLKNRLPQCWNDQQSLVWRSNLFIRQKLVN